MDFATEKLNVESQEVQGGGKILEYSYVSENKPLDLPLLIKAFYWDPSNSLKLEASLFSSTLENSAFSFSVLKFQ